MALSATLFRFRIDLSDVDRGVYQPLDFRTARHPSESDLYLITRVLAYSLNVQDGIEFSAAGLSDSEGPAILVREKHGNIDLWIEIGNPSSKKLHKAAKASRAVKVYTYKNPQSIFDEARENKIHHADQIEIVAFDPKFLERLSKDLPREVRWQVLCHDGVLTVSTDTKSEQTEIKSSLLSGTSGRN
jgi:uncharacterized protein YaeQ